MEKNGKIWINGGVTYIWLEFLINTKFRMEIYGHLAELLEQVSGVLGLLGSEKKKVDLVGGYGIFLGNLWLIYMVNNG